MAVQDAWETETTSGSPTTTARPERHVGRTWNDEEWSPASRSAAPDSRDVGLSKALGWFSVALGVTQLVAPRTLARTIGVRDDEDNRRLMQGLGLRELATGIAILAQPDRPGWLWARVGGDAMDLALLGSALRDERSDHGRVTAATAAVLGVTALDVLAGQRLGGNGEQRAGAGPEPSRGIRVRRSVTVQASPDEAYRFWRDFRNLPTFMSHLESVEVLDDRRSRWRAKAPAGTTVEWEAETIEDRPGELISWRSIPGSEVDNAGSVRFVPAAGGRGTQIHVELEYDPPAGKLGALVAKLFGEAPEQQVSGDLRRFKQVLETGEVVHSDASIHKGMHPARPSA